MDATAITIDHDSQTARELLAAAKEYAATEGAPADALALHAAKRKVFEAAFTFVGTHLTAVRR